MSEQSELSSQKESKRVNFWLNIFSKSPVYIIISTIIVTLFGILGYSMVNCWIKTKDFDEMLNCMTGGPYQAITDVYVTDSTKVDEGEVVEWTEKNKSRFELPDVPIIEEDISDLRAYWYQRYGGLLKLLIVIFLLSFLVFFEIYKYYRRRFFFRLEDENQIGYIWNIKANSEELELYKEKDFEEASKRLRQLQPSQPATPDYSFLILIEKMDKQDHLATLYDQMLIELTQQNIPYERYFFEGDPRLVYKEKYKEEYHFEYLKANYHDRQLVIVAQTETFFDAVSGELDSWTSMLKPWENLVVMNPKVPLEWSYKEIALAKVHNLLPANLDGIKTLQEFITNKKKVSLKHWIQNNQYPAPPDLESPELVQELKAYFDTYYEGREEHYEEGRGKNIFKWLCATAVYAELSWDMTLALGHALEELCEGHLVTPKNLYVLSSLRWFREGRIPETARAQLIGHLDEESVKLTRQTIIRLLKENEPLKGTYAYSLHQIRLAVQEAQLKPSIRKHLKVVQMVQDFTLNHELTDPAILNYLRKYPGSLPGIGLPASVSKALFEKGAPALGIQTWARVALGLGFVLLVLLTLDPNRLDKVYDFRGKDYYLANEESWMRFHAYKGNSLLSEGKLEEAKREYEMSLAYREANDQEDYLIAEYNLNLLKLKEGRRDEAESGFNTVSNKLDQLLAENRTTTMPEQKQVMNVKSATDYVRGKLDYEAGDIESAEDAFAKTQQNNTTRLSREANYGNALILLEKGLAEKGIMQENKIRLALTKMEDLALTDSSFFKEKRDVLGVLDSLAGATTNQRLKSQINRFFRTIKTGRVQEAEPAPRIDTARNQPQKEGIIIQKKFTYLTDFNEGKALVKASEGVAFADTNGQLSSEQYFEDARLFEEGLAAVKKNGRWGYINQDFETIIPFQYLNARDFQEGYASVKSGDKWGLIDKSGNIALRFIYDRPVIFDNERLRPKGAEALAVVKRGEGYQFINRQGKLAFDGATFKYARNFRGATARVKRWRRIYEIDRDGNCLPRSLKGGQCPGERWSIARKNEFKAHNKEISSISYSSDGRMIITASADSTARIWGESGALLTTLNHDGPVRKAVFSPKSRLVATITRSNQLYVWTQEGGKVKTFDIATTNLLTLAWSPNGNWLAAGGNGGKVYLYNMESMILANVFETKVRMVRAICFSPNGQRIAVGGVQNEIEIWALSGELFKKLPFTGQINDLSYSPNRPELAIASRESAAYILDIVRGETQIIEGHSDWLTHIEYSPDGNYLLTTSMDRTLRIWNEDDQNVFAVRRQGAIRSAAFSPDGESVALTFYDTSLGGMTIVYEIEKF